MTLTELAMQKKSRQNTWISSKVPATGQQKKKKKRAGSIPGQAL
jgi:hypothetical protein